MKLFEKIKDLWVTDKLRLGADSSFVIERKGASDVVVGVEEFRNSLEAGSRVNTLTAATTLNPKDHGNGKINLLSLLAGFDVTLPDSTGTGDSYLLQVGIVNTSNDYGILCANAGDVMSGSVVLIDTDTVDNSATGFATASTSDTCTLNGTTTGGLRIGDWVKVTDVASGVWHVTGILTGSGTIATPFAAEVS